MTPRSSDTLPGFSHLWRAIVAPVAAGVLAAGCAVTPPQEPTEVRIMAPAEPLAPALAAERARRYAKLQTALATDPQTQNRVLLIDPTGYSSGRQLFQDAQRKLQTMIANWPEPPQDNVLRSIIPPMSEIVSGENESLAPVNSGLFIKRGKETSPDLTLQSLSLQSFQNELLDPGDRNFICAAVGGRANNRDTTITHHFASLGFIPQTAFNIGFSHAMDKIDPLRIIAAEHEIGHCVGSLEPQRDETRLLKARRDEAKSDIFFILLEMQEGKSDIAQTIETMVQYRRAGQVRGFLRDGGATDHDSTATLRLLQQEFHDNPGMAAELKGLTITELGNRAARYAERGTVIDYPHLYDQTLDAKSRYALMQQKDNDFESRARFVSGHILIKGYKEMPQTLSADTALGIVQLAHAAENYLVQPPHSQLKQALAELRQKFPEQMREADRQFAAELKQYPPLPGFTTAMGVEQSRQTMQNHSRLATGKPGV